MAAASVGDISSGLAQIPGLTIAGPSPGSPSSGLAAWQLPTGIDSRDIVTRFRERHRIVVKMVEKHWFNGIRLSPHVFNTQDEIDRCTTTLRRELASL